MKRQRQYDGNAKTSRCKSVTCKKTSYPLIQNSSTGIVKSRFAHKTLFLTVCFLNIDPVAAVLLHFARSSHLMSLFFSDIRCEEFIVVNDTLQATIIQWSHISVLSYFNVLLFVSFMFLYVSVGKPGSKRLRPLPMASWTRLLWPLLQTVCPQEHKSMLLIRAPWVDTHSPGACRQAPPPGLAPKWGPGNPCPGKKHWDPCIFLFYYIYFLSI